MKTYKLTNETKNKVVLTSKFSDAEDAFGKYVSALMMAGVVAMRDSAYKFIGNDCWELSNGWVISVKEVA